ncbi:MAG: hypothetical protein ACRDNZ_00735, partial [Streptosporangiaceae bacterium]
MASDQRWFGQPSEDELVRTAYHEAGHDVIAEDMGRQVRFLSAVAGATCAGCTNLDRVRLPAGKPPVHLPLTLWSAEWQAYWAGEALITLAGDEAELRFAPRLGRTPERVAVAAIDLLDELPEISGEQRA